MASEKLTAALEWLADGHTLTKLHGLTRDGDCTCARRCGGRAGKHPVYKDPHTTNAVRTPEQAEAAFRSGVYNLGLVTGTPSGVVVLDVDTDHGKRGQGSLNRLATVHGWDDLTATRQHRTGGGGTQYLFRHTGGALKTTLSELGADLDFKAGTGGAFIVLPPSVSAKGPYEVLTDDPIQPLPRWLLTLCPRQGEVVGAGKPSAPGTGAYMAPPDAATGQRWDYYAEGIIEAELARLRDLQSQRTGWIKGIFGACCALYEVANSPWTTFGVREVERLIRKALPTVTDGSDFVPWVHVEAAKKRVGDQYRPVPAAPGR